MLLVVGDGSSKELPRYGLVMDGLLVIIGLVVLGAIGSVVWLIHNGVQSESRSLDDVPLRTHSPQPVTTQEHVQELRAKRIDPSTLRVLSLSALDSTRLRVKGSAYQLTAAERHRFGGKRYLLVRESENEYDPNAVAVYGNGRRVGYLSAAKAEALAPLLDQLDADAFEVAGAGTTADSMKLWVDLPKITELRRFLRERST